MENFLVFVSFEALHHQRVSKVSAPSRIHQASMIREKPKMKRHVW
jgi:hypothetical protein